MSERKETVFKLPREPRPGWPCPACGGLGTNSDGSASFGPDEVRITPATKCSLCRGHGRVNVTPLGE